MAGLNIPERIRSLPEISRIVASRAGVPTSKGFPGVYLPSCLELETTWRPFLTARSFSAFIARKTKSRLSFAV